MIHKIFSIFDEKAMAYIPPFILPTDGQAVRIFSDCVNSNSHQFGVHPEDYTIFRLGTFDDSNGLISVGEHRQSLGNGLEFIKFSQERDENGQELTPQIGDDPSVQPSPSSGNSA